MQHPQQGTYAEGGGLQDCCPWFLPRGRERSKRCCLHITATDSSAVGSEREREGREERMGWGRWNRGGQMAWKKGRRRPELWQIWFLRILVYGAQFDCTSEILVETSIVNSVEFLGFLVLHPCNSFKCSGFYNSVAFLVAQWNCAPESWVNCKACSVAQNRWPFSPKTP